MNPLKSTIFIKKALLFLVLLNLSFVAFTQNTDTTKHILNAKGSISTTNNGFSFIPAFSLGKPALIFNFNINSGKRLSFEPEFRFSIKDAKPWSFVFIWRYKLINNPNFQLVAGAHLPAIPFRTVLYEKNGAKYETLANYRFLPFELTPTVTVSKNASIGLFCMYARGFGADATRNTYFVGLRSAISNVKLSNNYSLRFNPQVFYLTLDKTDGYYAALNTTLAKKNFPFSISTMMNRPFKTEITSVSGKKFDWNISLVYAFNKNYVRQ
jgi:hypothetical protein